jgi:predicted Rossmann fold nucleotide-binding protein DprA/Smf involved in DNA uptake
VNIAISGTRNISADDLVIIKETMGKILLEHPEEILFGGARGVDTVALMEAFQARKDARLPRLNVIVPWRLVDQPAEARERARACADEIVELKAASKLDMGAYARRNQELVKRADKLVAFWDGLSHGTGMTIDMAREKGIPVQVVKIGKK